MFCYCFGNGISLLIDAVKEYCLVDRLMSFSKWIRDDYVNDCGFFFQTRLNVVEVLMCLIIYNSTLSSLWTFFIENFDVP